MSIKRFAKHLVRTHWPLSRLFPPQAVTAIECAIKARKIAHIGEISFAVHGALHGTPLVKDQTPRQHARDIFSRRRVGGTEHRNGLLIYLLRADRTVPIVADRGIDSKVGSHDWDSIFRTMEVAFKCEHYAVGVISGIQAMTQLLIKHFPASRTEQHARAAPSGPVSISPMSTRRAS